MTMLIQKQQMTLPILTDGTDGVTFYWYDKRLTSDGWYKFAGETLHYPSTDTYEVLYYRGSYRYVVVCDKNWYVVYAEISRNS